MPRFVIQEHYARSHHFDLRLKRDGVLVEDAAPEDGVPGATRKSIWEAGTYEAEELGEEMVIVSLHGRRLGGKYSILRAGENWLVHKMKPEGG